VGEPLQDVVDELLRELAASRVTLRLAAHGGYFGVAHEALAPGTPSVRNEQTVSLRTNRVAQLAAAGQQVVYDDCLAVDDDPEYRRMLEVYGGLRAQIVTPVARGDEVVGILSVHQLGYAREWSAAEIECCNRAVAQLAELV
jgi:GAF domain-containing protein